MAMRDGRTTRRAVIGHPVIRQRDDTDDAAIVADGIRRRQSSTARHLDHQPTESEADEAESD